MTPLLEVRDLAKHYRLPRESILRPPSLVHALHGLSFQVGAGRSLGIVGESGSGKSTLARLVMALEAPSSGSVQLQGRDLHTLPPAELRRARRDFQMVFQDPYGSLDPRQRVGRIVAEPLSALSPSSDEYIGRSPEGIRAGLGRPGARPGHTRAHLQRERVAEMLEAVGLRAADMDKYPHEFSGGQRQRIAIARALVTRPKLVVADEPVSALDVSVQAQVLNLLRDLQERFGVTYLFISHDLAVVEYVCDEVAVMQHGRIVERGTPEELFRHAAHPYTRALLDAVPRAEPGSQGRRKPA